MKIEITIELLGDCGKNYTDLQNILDTFLGFNMSL